MSQQMSDPQQSVQENSRESSNFENWLKKDPMHAVIMQSSRDRSRSLKEPLCGVIK